MSAVPTCPTCSAALIDQFDQAETRWICPQCDRLTRMFVKEEQNFWTGQPDVERIGFEWRKNRRLSPPSDSTGLAP